VLKTDRKGDKRRQLVFSPGEGELTYKKTGVLAGNFAKNP